jgi:hypothetical protein
MKKPVPVVAGLSGEVELIEVELGLCGRSVSFMRWENLERKISC